MNNSKQDYSVVQNVEDNNEDSENSSPAKELLFGKEFHDDGPKSHPVFSEMMELDDDDGSMTWIETARWLKFEENVEKGGRWSKPYVTTVCLHSMNELRSLISSGTVILDMDATDFEHISKCISSSMMKDNFLAPDKKIQISQTLLRRHIHQHLKKNMSFTKPADRHNDETINENLEDCYRYNSHFMKKIPSDAEACNILVGGVDYLDKPLTAFIRLKSSIVLGNLTEVPVPTRFLFLLLGPSTSSAELREMGRAMATLMSDEVFQEIAYRAQSCNHLLAGLDEILNDATVLPPGKWNPATRIQPSIDDTTRKSRKRASQEAVEELQKEVQEQKLREKSGLVRTGLLFGGLLNDIKRKAPWYWSDFKDAFHSQSIASWIFLYFACLSPIITFGGLLSQVTGESMAAMECLVAGFICGLSYGFFSGQPLTILATTGPVLVFETIVYEYCDKIGWDYMSFRLCIGTWIAIILMILVALDASAFVCYITRFTEDNFTMLVSVIFIYESVQNVLLIKTNFPIGSSIYSNDSYESVLKNGSMEIPFLDEINIVPNNETELMVPDETSPGKMSTDNIPNVFLMSVLLFLGTYLISTNLKKFKSSLYFPSNIRQFISDFAVTIAIVSMSGLDFYMGIPTPKLAVPRKFEPTSSKRGWFIQPLKSTPLFSVFVAIPPALLGTILIFMDQQITAVIVNRKQHKLKKGCGYHLDLFVLSFLIGICSFMGLPWFAASTVPSITHVNSLKLETESAAPGVKQTFLGVREQRVTHIAIFLTIGLSVFLTPILGFIPMPVLYGIFFFMGVESLIGLDLFNRILIIFMPNKYQPDYLFLREIPIRRVHLFTVIQLACLGCLWTVKSFSSTSILFPLMLVVMIVVRKLLEKIFTKRELRVLDDILPQGLNKEQKTLKNGGIVSKVSYYILGPKLKLTRKDTVEMC